MDPTQRKMAKIAREINKFTVRTLRAEGIGTAELDVLHAIRKNPGITQAGVCRITGLDKGAVARQTANLAAKGYLTRQDNPSDGRSQLLFATGQADRLKRSKAQVESLCYQWLTEPLSADEQQELARLLDVLYQRCKEESKADFPNLNKLVKEGTGDAE